MKFYFGVLIMMMGFTATAQEYIMEGHKVNVSGKIMFKENTAVLLSESDAAVAVIKKYLDDKTYISLLRIESNVSLFSSETKNQVLSEQRAAAVYEKLVSLGVDCKKLVVTGFGSTKPVADNSIPEGKAANTNIIFVNAALRGHLIGGMPADGSGKIVSVICD